MGFHQAAAGGGPCRTRYSRFAAWRGEPKSPLGRVPGRESPGRGGAPKRSAMVQESAVSWSGIQRARRLFGGHSKCSHAGMVGRSGGRRPRHELVMTDAAPSHKAKGLPLRSADKVRCRNQPTSRGMQRGAALAPLAKMARGPRAHLVSAPNGHLSIMQEGVLRWR